jgi:glutaredoxin
MQRFLSPLPTAEPTVTARDPAASPPKLRKPARVQIPAENMVDSRGNPPKLFTAAWCVYCKKARALLDFHAIPYREIDVETLYGSRARASAGNGYGVPLLVFKGRQIAGFSRDAYLALFTTIDP